MRRVFQMFLVLFGIIVIGISLAHLAVGPEAIIGGADVNPTSDGKDRFYAGLFLCYGVALFVVRTRRATQACVRHPAGRRIIPRRDRAVPSFAWAQLAVILVGAPHPFYVAMRALELALPPLMVLAAKRVACAEPTAGHDREVTSDQLPSATC
jgi:hypothetical protein